MLFEIALGYNFKRIVPRIYFDIGLPLYGIVGFTDGNAYLKETMDTKNYKLGVEIGVKPIITQRFDLIIPFGILFCWTIYEQKNPSYSTSGHVYDRIWDNRYINLFSGINAAFKLNNNFRIGLFSRIGFPVRGEEEYKETLRGNYVWTKNNSRTFSLKNDIKVLNFSLGVGILANL